MNWRAIGANWILPTATDPVAIRSAASGFADYAPGSEKGDVAQKTLGAALQMTLRHLRNTPSRHGAGKRREKSGEYTLDRYFGPLFLEH